MKDAFAQLLTRFLAEYLPGQRNLSANTIRAYRDTFVLLLRFCRDECQLPPEELAIRHLTVPLVTSFLDHIERGRQCSAATRNQRLAGIHSFVRFVLTECPEAILDLQRILLIPSKRAERKEVRYLSADEMGAIIRAPGRETPRGRRDTVLLALLYDTGARVQELIDLRVMDIRLEPPAQIRLTGKGRKVRHVPILPNTVTLLDAYLHDSGLVPSGRQDVHVLQNRYGGPLSRSGVRHILQKHLTHARSECLTLPETASPHLLRHTKAMHLLEAGNPLVVISKILGHADIKSTEIYARADMRMKRRALASVAGVASLPDRPTWQQDRNLLQWLKSL